MQVYYDLVLGLFLASPDPTSIITELPANRGGNCPIALKFLNNGQPTTLPGSTQFNFSGKAQSFFDAGLAVSAPNSFWSGPDGNANYNVLPSYNTGALNALFGYTYPTIDTLPHPALVSLNGEISWLKPGDTYWTKTNPWLLQVYNDVAKGIEGNPSPGGGLAGAYLPAYNSIAELEALLTANSAILLNTVVPGLVNGSSVDYQLRADDTGVLPNDYNIATNNVSWHQVL